MFNVFTEENVLYLKTWDKEVKNMRPVLWQCPVCGKWFAEREARCGEVWQCPHCFHNMAPKKGLTSK